MKIADLKKEGKLPELVETEVPGLYVRNVPLDRLRELTALAENPDDNWEKLATFVFELAVDEHGERPEDAQTLEQCVALGYNVIKAISTAITNAFGEGKSLPTDN